MIKKILGIISICVIGSIDLIASSNSLLSSNTNYNYSIIDRGTATISRAATGSRVQVLKDDNQADQDVSTLSCGGGGAAIASTGSCLDTLTVLQAVNASDVLTHDGIIDLSPKCLDLCKNNIELRNKIGKNIARSSVIGPRRDVEDVDYERIQVLINQVPDIVKKQVDNANREFDAVVRTSCTSWINSVKNMIVGIFFDTASSSCSSEVTIHNSSSIVIPTGTGQFTKLDDLVQSVESEVIAAHNDFVVKPSPDAQGTLQPMYEKLAQGEIEQKDVIVMEQAIRNGVQEIAQINTDRLKRKFNRFIGNGDDIPVVHAQKIPQAHRDEWEKVKAATIQDTLLTRSNGVALGSAAAAAVCYKKLSDDKERSRFGDYCVVVSAVATACSVFNIFKQCNKRYLCDLGIVECEDKVKELRNKAVALDPQDASCALDQLMKKIHNEEIQKEAEKRAADEKMRQSQLQQQATYPTAASVIMPVSAPSANEYVFSGVVNFFQAALGI